MVSPAFPGLFFCFAGFVLLIFASVSPPAWNTVNFLDATANGSRTLFGVFGRCVVGGACTNRSVGYNLIVGNVNLTDESALQGLVKALILHPIAGGVGFFAFLMGLLGVMCASRFATVMMAVLAAIAAFASLVIFVIDMVLWNLVKNRVSAAGGSATLGNCNWFTVGAVVAFFLAMCTSFCGAFGRFASGRMAGEKY